MSSWIPFLGKSSGFNADKFEKDLKSISSSILSNEKSLVRYKRVKTQYKTNLLYYTIGIYLSYFAYVYISNDYSFKNLLVHELAIILLFPLLITALYYLIEYFYTSLIVRKEKKLEFLKSKHQEKIDELKESTNFHKTNELLARFSTGEDLQQLEKEAGEVVEKRRKYLQLIHEGESQSEALKKLNLGNGDGKTKALYESVLNKLLGEDEMDANHRYALICENCFQHNGLAPPGVLPLYVKYICPNCGLLNGEDEPSSENLLLQAPDESNMVEYDEEEKPDVIAETTVAEDVKDIQAESK
ncbi:hypothetical protein B5S29_g591 [[Candida] boidinii]|uniref:Unnamed protein product n=1 Tax=Candida boidinii TaxID=5477 RepID=A0ACB5TUL3_CANBO|nr:hypothetical protein B5S29_g591 [[Candida] boidinii]GME95692.1 unnamed protein product [[Candida] boidinii]